MVPCNAAPCPNPLDELGNVLYAGAFNPQFPTTPTPSHQPQEDFIVTVPDFQDGQTVQLAALAYTLVGVSAGFCVFMVRCANKGLVLQAGPSSTIEQATENLVVQCD